MFTDHKKFAAAPAPEAKPVVYGLPAKPKTPVATVTYSPLTGREVLRVFGVEVGSCPRFSENTEGLYALADKINAAAAKEKCL